jgi:TP901 family phage tail tape measure protein
MANSDIIKIGFDYRASLAQFEKETNGVFDGISNKAGKQKIIIQLDAKDDKVIDKIKELQKLKLDKFTFEFGNSGLKEQLQTFDKLENKINEIISLSKGIDLSFNTKNKTDAYNQLKKYADAFKDYYGNEEAMATNAGAKAGYAYYKAYEEALRKGVAQSKLEKVTIDFDVNDSFFSKERIVGNRIKDFENFQKYGNADESNLIAEITSLENRLLKFNSAYSQVKANLGDAPITPEITKNIEEYVRLLEVAESRAKDAELFGYSSEDINSDKDLANMYLDFAKEDATAENKKYIESLKQEETQAIATAEAEQKLAEAQKETVSNTSNSNNSQIEELKSDIQEVKTELGDVKDRISSIESNGFENVRDDVEKTKKSVKELNSELTEMKSNLSSTSQESNISSGDFKEQSTEIDLYHNLEKRKVTYDEIIDRIQTIVSLKEKEKSLSKTSDDTKLYQNLYDENDINWAGDTEGTINRISDRLKEIYIKYNGKISLINENDIQEAAYLLDILKGAGESPNLNKSQEKFYQNKKFSNDSLFDNIHVDSQKTGEIDKINTELSETYRWFNQLEGVSLNENIANEIKSLISDMQIGGKTANEYANDLLKIFNIEVDSNSAIEQQNKLQSELKETESQAEKTAMAVKEISSTTSQDQKKDAFPDKVSASVEKIADGFKEVKQETEEATESAKDYVRTISQVGEWNVDSKVSVVKERNDGQLETWNYDAKRGKKDITYDKDGNINYGDPIITTISNYKQLEQTIVKADDKLRDLRKALEDIKEINPNASTKNIEKQIQYQKEYISLLEQTVKMISQGDEYFLNEQQIIDARKKATTEYDLKQGTKSDISNAKQSAKANEQAIRQEQKLTDELRKQEEQARKTALSYTESASKKLSDAISKYSYGDSSDATAMMKQMNRGLSNFGDLSSIESNIKNFDSIVDAIITDLKHSHEESLSALNNEIKAEETMQKQKDAFNKSNLNAIDVEIQKREEEAKAFSNSLKAQMESQQQAESQMSKLESTLSKYQTKKDTYDATIARFNDGGWTSDTYLKNVQAVKDAVKKYEDLLSDIKAKGGIASEEDIQNLKEYEAKIKDTIATVTNMSAAEKGYNFVSAQKELDKIHKLLNENSKMSSEAKNKIRAYYAEIESGNPSMSLDRIHGEIMKIYNAEVEAGRAGRSFFDTLKNSGFHQLAAQMAGMFGVYDVINVVRQGVNTVRELDEAMTEVHKVSNATETQYASFRDTISSTAKEIATTNKELLNSSADFLRLGYSLDQASDLAKNATLFVNVGDGVDITEATEDMITAMKAFDIQAKDSIKIVDDYNQIGNQFALSASDIGEAMKRSASALETGNNSFEQSIGLITAMNEIVQNSENTGNSLKVLSLRLRGAKAELEDMQEDTDGLCDSTSKLREQIKSLTGVDIMLDDNTFKSTTDIIKELGAVWDKLSDSSQAATLELIAGKSRANNVAALLKNYQKIDEVMESLGDAEGSAMRENEAIVDSINGRIKVLSATAEEFWQKFIDTDLVKELVSLASDLLNILTKIVNIGNGAGTLGLIGAGTGIFKFIKNFDWVFKPYIKTLSNSF